MVNGVETRQERDFAITVEVTCTRTDAALDQWRLDTYTALANSHTDLMSAYQDKVKAQTVQAATAPSLGQNPTQNRLIERAELKKACIARLSGTDLYGARLGDIPLNNAV